MTISINCRRVGYYVDVSITVDSVKHDLGLRGSSDIDVLLRDLKAAVDEVSDYADATRPAKGETK